MQTTTNYGFKKPESNDPYNINDLNESLDIIDTELNAAELEYAQKVKHEQKDFLNEQAIKYLY